MIPNQNPIEERLISPTGKRSPEAKASCTASQHHTEAMKGVISA
jgi:hypothetical protein